MNIEESWEKALKKTEIIRSRIQSLKTFEPTSLPYIFLAESSINVGDSVVRKGAIVVEQPSIVLPDHLPQFEGFEFDKDFESKQDFLTTFFMVRGIRFPSLKYNNKTESLEVYEGRLQAAIDHHKHQLEISEDVNTGLVIGPEDCWQFSVLIFVCHQVLRQADVDIKKLMEKYKKESE